MDELDQPIQLFEVPALLPKKRSGKPIHPFTIYRWVTTGKKGVVLETTGYCPRYTTRRLVLRFLEELKIAGRAAQVRAPKSRQKALAAANRELDARLGPRKGRAATRDTAHA